MARATTKQQVLDGINKLTLQTNKNGQYTHNAILLLQKGVRRVLQSQFNPSDPGKSMEKLLNTGDNRLTLVKSTDVITAGSMLKRPNKMLWHCKPLPVNRSSPSSPHKQRHKRKPTN